ncbi:MAG: heme exporter protein CcmD [Gammaproteobacteria bacterium RIFCSPHIGHO2_12_FULL_42_10]|nr:MAG: heme exporter protein CcmD [Gammaproteobacteria bacterium RIFCSPHIGHO2_12_FULL_42_10]
MMQHLLQWLRMGGYGWYVWGAYGSVFILLGLQWYFTWRSTKVNHESHS